VQPTWWSSTSAATWRPGLAAIERLRAEQPTVAIFAVAYGTEPELILQAMRAGANEYFSWPVPEDAFHGALRRTAARREGRNGGAKAARATLVFFGAKGGAGTTTVAVNCAVELARLTKRSTMIVDLKPCFGEVALFLGVRPRYTIIDAIDNLHRLDQDFMRELVAKHKSGLEILAGSEQYDRPGAVDASAMEELFRVLGRSRDFVVVDAGNAINSCSIASLYAADTVFIVANPDVPSVRNAQRLVDRLRQLGVGGERVRCCSTASTEQGVIAPKQIETALGLAVHHSFPSDYATVSAALNSGVPLTLSNTRISRPSSTASRARSSAPCRVGEAERRRSAAACSSASSADVPELPMAINLPPPVSATWR
jgi:pilus assembly protein CpaE